jgi:beta-glucanase (GH16 family)
MGPKAQTYGRWEIKARASDGAGFWPNMQLWPTEEKWPTHIEFDIFESSCRHEGPSMGDRPLRLEQHAEEHRVRRRLQPVPCLGRRVDPNAITVAVDGKQVVNVIDKAQIPTTPDHLCLQTDMGDWAGKPISKDPTRWS